MSEEVGNTVEASESIIPDAAAENFVESEHSSVESEGEVPSEEIAEGEVLSEGEEAALDAAGLDEAQKQEVRKIRSLTLKVNGKEYQEELPFEIDDNPEAIEYMKRQLQMAKFGQTKAQDYSKLENDIGSFFEALKTDPRKVLSDPSIGLDLKELAKMIIEEEIEQAQKSPELIEKEKLEARLRELEAERETEKETFRKQELERVTQQEFDRYDMLMDKALTDAGLPKSPYIVKKMADYMISGISKGMDIQPSDVVGVVKEEMNGDLKEMFSSMPAEVLSELIGNDSYDKVRKHRVSKARKTTPKSLKSKKVQDVGKNSEKKVVEKQKPKTIKELFGV